MSDQTPDIDIVGRLRIVGDLMASDVLEAADEIERLRAENQRLRQSNPLSSEAEIPKLMDALEVAWGIIANGRAWDPAMHDEWEAAKFLFRDEHWHPALDRDRHPERKPVMDRDFAVLSRSALLQFFGEMALPPWRDDTGALVGGGIDCALIASRIIEWMEANDLGDLYAQIDGSEDGPNE